MFIWLVKFAHQNAAWHFVPVGVSELPERPPLAGVVEFIIYDAS